MSARGVLNFSRWPARRPFGVRIWTIGKVVDITLVGAREREHHGIRLELDCRRQHSLHITLPRRLLARVLPDHDPLFGGFFGSTAIAFTGGQVGAAGLFIGTPLKPILLWSYALPDDTEYRIPGSCVVVYRAYR